MESRRELGFRVLFASLLKDDIGAINALAS